MLSAGYGSTVYPLQGDSSRFTFQVAVLTPHPPGLTELRELLAARMPGYAAELSNFDWSGSAEFHPALASTFGHRRVWLAGDAAHCTSPLGGQSINTGVHEADDLARRKADGPRPQADRQD